ncbi:hypothetical protein [Desulfosarcina sp.]|uniref:hypothetical protein n=1 Tax=Desulfosarcina sp. TaxID=2027861 RepID=UPI0029AF5C8B|nr:hypothetical protein [Desulfosarcina sp.]MDX2451586.1 hypothetical protein [Desulfosarcina sp.]MDX2489385.1 hypothetical protein [Desulfosarcina sp.]
MSDRNTIKKWIQRTCLLVVLVLSCNSSYGADKRVVKQLNVLGSAAIHGKNLADGRQNSVNDALVAAVGQVVMEMLTGETVVRRFQQINDNILAKRDVYIQNYRVLTESVSGNTVRTLVQVDIAVDRVSRDLSRLGLALAGAVYPRILFMVAERNVTDADFTYWWGDRRLRSRTISEGALAVTLKATGFEIIDLPDLTSPLSLPVNAPEADLVALAGRLGADVLVSGYGTAEAAPNTMGGDIKAYEAVLEARAFDVRTGQPIGRTRQKSVVSGQDGVAGGREALSGAGALAGDDLARQIIAVWQQEKDRSAVIEVAVEGTGGHIASFVRLRTAISSLSGVNDLKMKEMTADRADMAVTYQGSARSLADALLLKTFSGFGIDIFEVTPEAVRIRLVNQ